MDNRKIKSQTEESPLHKRKKGKKEYKLQSRLTPQGAERNLNRIRERNEKSMQWAGWNQYEKLKEAAQAIERCGKNFYGEYHDDYEYRIIDQNGTVVLAQKTE